MHIKIFILLISLIYSNFAGVPCVRCAIARGMSSNSLEITQARPCDDKLVLEFTCGSCYTGQFDFTKLLNNSKDDSLLFKIGCQKNLESKKPYEYYEPISIYFRRLIFEYVGGKKELDSWEAIERTHWKEYRPFWNIRAIRSIQKKIDPKLFIVFRSLHDYIYALKGNIKYCLLETNDAEKIRKKINEREDDAKLALKLDINAKGLFEDVFRNLSPVTDKKFIEIFENLKEKLLTLYIKLALSGRNIYCDISDFNFFEKAYLQNQTPEQLGFSRGFNAVGRIIELLDFQSKECSTHVCSLDREKNRQDSELVLKQILGDGVYVQESEEIEEFLFE
jgi:sulfur transfer complex TusBCD TusB component (DsrH family)